MRLINVDTLRLEEFHRAETAPPYAILSHTWGQGEVTFQDFQSLETASEKEGFDKIRLTCLQAKADGYNYAWADTCCIDKSSSHELNEAINSMYQWYKSSAVCYTYLEDVPGNCPPLCDADEYTSPRQLEFICYFESSRWFTRGWTLQELIAPERLYFFGRSWNCIGSRASLMHRVSGITNIQTDVLSHERPLSDLSVARRLSWAATRETTRKEDEAYSLLGILDVSMPLLYGSGERAFLRLQEEIIKQSTDQSLFAWDSPAGFIAPRELLLAPSPQCFRNCGSLRRRRYASNESAFTITNKGLEITLPVVQRRLHEDPQQPYVTLGILDCKHEGSNDVLALVMNQHPININSGSLALELYVSGYEADHGRGLQHSRLLSIPQREVDGATPQLMTITRDLQSLAYIQAFNTNAETWFPLRFTGGHPARLPRLREVYPDRCWSDTSKTMKLHVPRMPFGAFVVDTTDGVSVLICFGMERAPAKNVPPERRLFGMCFIDPECPVLPHLDRIVRKSSCAPNTDSLRLNSRENIVARLWLGAITVCVETGGDNGRAGSVTGVPQSMSPVTSPLSPQPVSPQLYTRRPSSSHSQQGSFRRESLLQQSLPRRDSVLQDDRSERSERSHEDFAPRVSRLVKCEHCVRVTEARLAEEQRLAEEARQKAKEVADAKRKRERNEKVINGAKKASVGASVGGMLWDLAEGLEFLA